MRPTPLAAATSRAATWAGTASQCSCWAATRPGGAEQVLTIDPQCQLIAQAPLRGQVLSFSAAGRYLSLLTGSGLEIYTRDMSLYRALEDTQDARFTALSPNGSALLADSQQAWLYIPS